MSDDKNTYRIRKNLTFVVGPPEELPEEIPTRQEYDQDHLKRGGNNGPLGNAVMPGTAKYDAMQRGEARHNLGGGTSRDLFGPGAQPQRAHVPSPPCIATRVWYKPWTWF